MRKLAHLILNLIDEFEDKLNRRRLRRIQERSLHKLLWERATAQTADFVETYLPEVMVFSSKAQTWSLAARKIGERFEHGVCLEFGVAGGATVNWFSARLPAFQFYGFDSFTGLAEDWVGHHSAKGAYTQNGILPKVNSNVALIKGWFDATLPAFLQHRAADMERLRFVHIDSDTYEAATIVLAAIGRHLKPGCLILFDELVGYPNWRNGEFKALQEAQARFGFTYKFLAFSSEQALIEIT